VLVVALVITSGSRARRPACGAALATHRANYTSSKTCFFSAITSVLNYLGVRRGRRGGVSRSPLARAGILGLQCMQPARGARCSESHAAAPQGARRRNKQLGNLRQLELDPSPRGGARAAKNRRWPPALLGLPVGMLGDLLS
jgi:hypothetical protein